MLPYATSCDAVQWTSKGEWPVRDTLCNGVKNGETPEQTTYHRLRFGRSVIV
jgi:hypothetical protein